MITQRIDPLDFIAIVPPQIDQDEPRLSLDQLRARFAQNDGLPFVDVLTEACIPEALAEHEVTHRDRVFGPTIMTIWGFRSDRRSRLMPDHASRLPRAPLAAILFAGRRQPQEGLDADETAGQDGIGDG
jgi:hypothetical protein